MKKKKAKTKKVATKRKAIVKQEKKANSTVSREQKKVEVEIEKRDPKDLENLCLKLVNPEYPQFANSDPEAVTIILNEDNIDQSVIAMVDISGTIKTWPWVINLVDSQIEKRLD